MVNASIPALVALRGLPLDPRPNARLDRAAVRRLYDCPDARVAQVSRPWRRKGRRFVQIRVETDDVRRLSQCPPFSWSAYQLEARDGLLVYVQRVGAPAGSAPMTNWDGSEVAAFRMHLPSRIQYHDSPSREVERGNILTWEQRLSERMAGRPLAIEVRMDRQSILRRTLTVFAVAVSSALLLLALIVWWVRWKGHMATAAGG
jgi:hypothetical protein